MALSLFSKSILIFSLIFYPFVLTQCPDPSVITDQKLEIDTESVVLDGEGDPEDVVTLVTRVNNCLAYSTNPDSYSYIGITVKYKLREMSTDFFYFRLVYFCSGTSFVFQQSLSEINGTAISGTDPAFLSSGFVNESCHSCDARNPSNDYLCVECNTSCMLNTDTLGYCHGPSATECCHYTYVDECVAECPGGFNPTNTICVCDRMCLNSGTLNFTSCQCDCATDYTGSNCETQYLPCDSNSCLNGLCVDGLGPMVYTCSCDDGYTGTQCGTDIDDCVGDPCNPGSCNDEVNAYTCSCPPGYRNTGMECVNINECDDSPCENGGTCTDTPGNYTCQCPTLFGGSNCTDCLLTCENSGVVLESSCTCDCPGYYTGSTCADCSITSCGNGTYTNCECYCYSGHTGEFCQESINDCTAGICQHSGICIDGNSTYQCDCSGTFYEGTNCGNETNNCDPNPCIHGTCTSSLGDYSCDCSGTFYEGTNCGNETNNCDPNPCIHGTCTSSLGDYSCDCSGTFYEGTNCGNETNNCDPNPCIHGTCTSSLGDYSCDCFGTFYEGTNCGNETNNCDHNPCIHGTCTSSLGDYSCDCSGTFYEGTNCGNETNNCDPNPCIHGTCISSLGAFSCNCDGNFSGAECDECLISCDNSGQVTDDCNCDCNNTGFEGSKCESDTNECLNSPSPCPYFCHNTVGGYTCSCPTGYTGSTCETDIDECITDPCQNGVCINSVGDFTCNCEFGYNNTLCDNVITDCSYINCQNGGVCDENVSPLVCDCLTGFTGARCESSACQDGKEFINNDCVDIDECIRYPKVCGHFPAICEDSIPFYTCGCPDGYSTIDLTSQLNYCMTSQCVAKQCLDINECESSQHNCHSTQLCINTNGSYYCRCPSNSQLSINVCILSLTDPDCGLVTDASGHIWPGVNRGSSVTLKCLNSDYGVAIRRCHFPCDCGNGEAYWGVPELSQCRSVELQVLVSELVALDAYQVFNTTRFQVVVKGIQIFASEAEIIGQDILILTETIQEISRIIEMLDLLEIELLMDVLRIVDVILATTPVAWNEVGSVAENILLLHGIILTTADRISDYLYTVNAKVQFQFNSDVTNLIVIKFDNYTNENFSPTSNLKLVTPIITNQELHQSSTISCHTYILMLHLTTLHEILNYKTPPQCSTTTTTTTTTTTKSHVYPIDLFTYGVYSNLCLIPLLELDVPLIYRVNYSILEYDLNEVSYQLNYITNYDDYLQKSNSFTPSSCQGPIIQSGDLIFTCDTLQNFILTYSTPEDLPFHSTTIGIILRILYLLSAVLSTISIALLLSRCITMIDGMVFTRINVILTIIFSQTVLVISVDRTENHHVCVVFRFIMHYLSLSTLLWSLIDVLNVCLVAVFESYRFTINSIYLVIGYVLPVVPIVFTVSISSCVYTRTSTFCLPSIEDDLQHVWYIITPILLLSLLFVCLITFVVVVVLIYKRDNIRVELSENRKLFVRIILSSLTLPIILFIWWSSTLYAYSRDETNIISQMISLVTGSVIGMFILFIYTLASVEQIKPSESGRKERGMNLITHNAMERIINNPLFKDSENELFIEN